MAVTACSEDELATSKSTFDGKGELVQLGEGFTISVAKGGDAQTRAYDATTGQFMWMPGLDPSGNLGTDEVPEKIGLCWTGVNNANPDKAPAQATSSMVYTNYEFTHAGWLYTGQTAPELDLCDFYVKNGEYNTSAGAVSPAVTAAIAGTSYEATTSSKTLNLKGGFFNTKNSAIYSGEYIVYHPYNGEFFDSPIVASAPRAITLKDASTNDFAAMSEYGFGVGYVGEFQGGQLSDQFVTNVLTGAVYLGIKNTDAAAPVKLKQVTLYAAGEGDNFIIKQELSASAIKAANNVGANIGTGLYLGQAAETSKTIAANFESSRPIASSDLKPAYVVLPVLPTTISKLNILLIDENNKVAIVECGQQEIVALASETYSLAKLIDLKDVEFKNDFIVTDAASLGAVLATIDGLGADDQPTAAKKMTVQIIGDVTLSEPITKISDKTWYEFVTFEGGKIIVPADKQLTLKNKVTINSDIDVMDAGCCGTKDGILLLADVTLGGEINNRGDIKVGTGNNVYTANMKDATINNLKGIEKTAEYEGTIVVKAKTTLMMNGSSSIVNYGQIATTGTGVPANDGTITLASGSTAAIDNKGTVVNGGNLNVLSSATGLINSETASIFVDKVGSQLAGYGMNKVNPGEFICEVDNQTRYNTALKSAIRPTTIVRFVGGASYEIKTGDVKNEATSSLVGFEIASSTAIVFGLPSGVTADLVSTIKSLTVTSATSVTINKLLKVNTNAYFNAATTTTVSAGKNFAVVGQMNVNAGKVVIADATASLAAASVNATGSTCALNVAEAGTVEFGNGGKSYFGVITNNGSINIKVATGAGGNVAHEVWCNSFTGAGTWANNSYPLILAPAQP